MQKEKIIPINGLKGLSCLIIMLYHYRFFLVDNGIKIIEHGHYFVEVFVAISGFLIAYNYQDRAQTLNFKNFVLKRYIKIMPLYWVTELLMYVAEILANMLQGKNEKWNPIYIFWEFTGLYTGWFGQTDIPKNNPLWTVCCLFICYILYYTIVKISIKSFSVYRLIITFILLGGVSLLQDSASAIINVNEDLLYCILSFIIGLSLYEIYRNISEHFGQIVSWSLFGTFVGTIIVCYNSNLYMDIGIDNIHFFIAIFIFCPLIICSAIYIKPFRYLCSSKVLQYFGDISIDVYMWHWVIRVYMGSRPFYLNEHDGVEWLILIVVSIIVAIFSHFYFVPWLHNMASVIMQKIKKS